MRFFTTFSLLLLLLVFSNCKNRPSTPASSEVSATATGQELPPDFQTFYEKFHADTAFQMTHIQFPLAGDKSFQTPDSSGMVRQKVTWQRDKWVLHYPIDLQEGAFQQEWQQIGDMMIIEKIREKQTGFYIERRFAKMGNNEWELIYYGDF